jgi:UDP-N-acetylglucosamine--N-acetylmuramyl-(pentapeptide) pyrophosphoryl-undecaprenol N-acetylglucosamine transferase
MRIPVFTHEQTIEPGLSNRVIGRFAKKIFLSFKLSRRYFKKRNTEVTGNPVREQIRKVNKKPFSLKKTNPVIYVTGGSLGSHSINLLIEEILPELLEEYTLIHQAGNVKEYNDFERLNNYAKTLPEELQNRYFLREHFSTEELGYVYSITDLVIGRSGANTFFELLELEKPAIFIPLPWSAHKEQQKQAELYKKNGLGEVFYQTGKSKDLLALIYSTIENIATFKKQFSKTDLSYARNAAQTIIKTVVG